MAAGLDYPGVGPEHSYYKAIKRATYVSVTDKEAQAGLKLLSNKNFSSHFSYFCYLQYFAINSNTD